MKEQILTALKGLGMGIAEVIPGVSGGTIAFITGIYQRLLSAINSFNFSLIDTWKSEGIGGVWKSIDGTFLLSLFIGMGIGLTGGIFVITDLMETHPEPLWGFFFGLVVASVWVLRTEVHELNVKNVSFFILGIIIAVIITSLTPVEGSKNLPYVYMSGIFAICALMLPGISGSFILLIMGMYTIIIPTLKKVLVNFNSGDIIIIMVFALGCLTGVASFSRVLTWLFKKQHVVTMATMLGFLVGSVYKIWPWRNVTSIADKETGLITRVIDFDQLSTMSKDEYKIISEQLVFPAEYMMSTPKTVITVVALVTGFLFILSLDYFSKKSEVK
jgi:putative membrane protein